MRRYELVPWPAREMQPRYSRCKTEMQPRRKGVRSRRGWALHGAPVAPFGPTVARWQCEVWQLGGDVCDGV